MNGQHLVAGETSNVAPSSNSTAAPRPVPPRRGLNDVEEHMLFKMHVARRRGDAGAPSAA